MARETGSLLRATGSKRHRAKARRVACIVLLLLIGTGAAEAREPERESSADASRRSPMVNGEISFGIPLLRASFRIALRKIDRVEPCQALFSALGSDGVETLQRTTYTMAESEPQLRVCRNAEAFTTVGGSEVWLCPGFGWMSEREAASVLIHEALHSAGLGERPNAPDGPTSNEIDEMVHRDCRF